MLLVNHVPKCAGTTLLALLENAFAESEVLSYRALSRQGFSWDDFRPMGLTLPSRQLEGKRLAFTHFGEDLRERIGDAYSVVLLRSPVERWRSLFRHALRAPAAAPRLAQALTASNCDLDAPAVRRAALRLSQCAYLAPDRLTAGETVDQAALGAAALAALETYDLVVHEANYQQSVAWLGEVLGEVLGDGLELNAAPDGDEPAFLIDPGFGARMREIAACDFDLYDSALQLAASIEGRIDEDREAARRHARGRLAPKHRTWRLTGEDAASLTGFGHRQLFTGDAENGERLVRRMAAAAATVEAPLQGPGMYELRCVWLFERRADAEALRVTMNGAPCETTIDLPIRDGGVAVLRVRGEVGPRPGLSRIGFRRSGPGGALLLSEITASG